MPKQRIIVRADGSATIGYGHVHRMLSLAKVLQGGFDCIFVSHDEPSFLLDELRTANIGFIRVQQVSYKLSDQRNPNEEIAFDMEEILKGDEIVVLDGYWFGIRYQKAILEKGSKLVCIDDQAEIEFVSDAVINHSPGIKIEHYQGKSLSTMFFLGTGYSLTNVPRNFVQPKEYRDFYTSLLIGMGGADPLNFTCKILRDFPEFVSSFADVVVLTGNSFAYFNELNELRSGFPNLRIVSNLKKTDVYSLMASCQVAILSASTMAIEYAEIGGILSVVQTAENQKFLYQGLLSLDAALSIDELVVSGTARYQELIESQKNLFDGKSNERLISIFNDLDVRSRIKLVNADRTHMEQTYEWATHPEIRKYSFSQKNISTDEHAKWFTNKINDKNCLFLIGFLDGKAIGSIRFDVNENVALISYLIDPQYHSRGLGSSLLSRGIECLKNSAMEVKELAGYVIPGNIASIKVFERMAFYSELQQDRIRYYKFLNTHG